MKRNLLFGIIGLILGCVLIFVINQNSNCEKYSKETYRTNNYLEIDSLYSEFEVIRSKLKLKDIRDNKFESYRMLSAGSLNSQLKIVDYYKLDEKYYFKFRIFTRDSLENYSLTEEYKTEIQKVYWKHIISMIYSYNYWNVKQLKSRLTTDGIVVIIEGIRPNGLKCKKRTRQIAVRYSPEKTDGILWLYEDILLYSYRLKEIRN